MTRGSTAPHIGIRGTMTAGTGQESVTMTIGTGGISDIGEIRGTEVLTATGTVPDGTARTTATATLIIRATTDSASARAAEVR